MSSLASFYLVRQEDVAGLKAAAAAWVPPSRWIIWWHTLSGQWRHRNPFWEYLMTHAERLEEYEWSGYVIAFQVSAYLQSHSIDWTTYSDFELSRDLSAVGEWTASIWVFNQVGAAALLKKMEMVPIEESLVAAFMSTDEMEPTLDEPLPNEAVMDGLVVLQRWLARVDDQHIGLLWLG